MGFTFDFFVKTDIGIQRSRNEDFFGLSNDYSLCLVADGMGGHLGGDIASRMAVNIIFNYFKSTVSLNSTKKYISKADEEVLRNAIKLANAKVFTKGSGNPNLRDMGTTIVASWFRNDYVSLASVGDSRIYMLRNDSLYQMTTDHSWVAELVKRKLIPPEEAINHPLKNIITRAIGIEKKVKVDTFTNKFQEGDVYLLCTDGLSDYVEDFRIKDVLTRHRNELDTAIQKLIDLANFVAGADNITIALIDVKKS